MAYKTVKDERPYFKAKNIAQWINNVYTRRYATFIYRGSEGKGYYQIDGELIPADVFEAANPIELEKASTNTLDGRSSWF